MIKSIIGIIFIFCIFIACSCSERVPVDEKNEHIDSSGEGIIRIVFKFPGDDIGAPEQQVILHKIITSIKSEETGDILSSGFGMGKMEINVKLKEDEPIKKIKRIIADNYPEANYSITKPLPRN